MLGNYLLLAGETVLNKQIKLFITDSCMSVSSLTLFSFFILVLVKYFDATPRQWATYHFGTYFLELKVRLVWVRLGYVMLFPAKINIIFRISTSNNAGISKIYA